MNRDLNEELALAPSTTDRGVRDEDTVVGTMTQRTAIVRVKKLARLDRKKELSAVWGGTKKRRKSLPFVLAGGKTTTESIVQIIQDIRRDIAVS